MHRHKGLSDCNAALAADRQQQFAAPADQFDQVAGLQVMAEHVLRIEAQHSFADVSNKRAAVPVRLMPCH